MKPSVGVRFKRAGKIYFFDCAGHPDLSIGDHVVVDTTHGRELGRVVVSPEQLVEARPSGRLKPILRAATWKDLADQARMRTEEQQVLTDVREDINRHELPMRAVLAEHNFDGSRLTVYFTSEEQRVDFRALVRDLSKRYTARVHLRQIGPRDRAKVVGGIDRCGRELCCSTWMPDFKPIQIRMAKNQQLPLNPSEISGVCGKLLCCLSFEDDQYSQMKQGMPKVGAKLTSAVGRGRVVDVNLITRKITIQWETGTRVEVDAEEFAEQQSRRSQAFGDQAPPGSSASKPDVGASRPDTGASDAMSRRDQDSEGSPRDSDSDDSSGGNRRRGRRRRRRRRPPKSSD